MRVGPLYHWPVTHANHAPHVGHCGIAHRKVVIRVGWFCWGAMGLDAPVEGGIAMWPVFVLRLTLVGEALLRRAERLSVKAQMIGFCLQERPEIDMSFEDTQKVRPVH